jgi:kynurenine formamidase
MAPPQGEGTGGSRTLPRLRSLVRQLIQDGRLWELSHEMYSGMPSHPLHPPFVLTLMQRHGDVYRAGGYSFANGIVIMSGHHGTHVDAVGHVSVDGRLHGGIDAFEAQRGREGLRSLSAADLSPFICRGVLLDVAAARGSSLPGGYAITLDEAMEVAEKQKVDVREGDAVLIRTGWGSRWADSGRFFDPDEGQPGPDESLAQWLINRQVCLSGSDTMVYEVLQPGQNAMPVHSALLYGAGIPIIEMLDLEALARDKVREFLFIALPLRLRGATGSPIRAVALR